MHSISTKPAFPKALAAISSLVLCLTLGACGSSSSSSQSSSSSSSGSSSASSSSTASGMQQIAGVTATGTLGKKPTIAFHHPMTVQNNTYAILQKGNGAAVNNGDRVCAQGIALNAKDGTELMSTWEKNTPDCSLDLEANSTNSAYYQVIKGQRLNTTIAFGVNDSNSSGTSYIMALTLVSKSKALTRAEGTKVSDVPSDLPKVTLASNGKPSIDLNGYKPTGQLVSQTLIKGSGGAVKSTQTVQVKYTGWTLDTSGKLFQFDSSWTKDQSTSFSLDSVVTGWKTGLTGQTIGSQVLLVIPPSDGYGSKVSGKIPANSTLYFVVDILYAS